MNNELSPHFNQYLTHENESDRKIVLIVPEKNFQREIINEYGGFTNFPGIENEVLIAQHINSGTLESVAKFVTHFEKYKDGKALVIWEVQPDGRYWADEDGFGAEYKDEIRLYSYLDEEGNFLFPFKIYNIGVYEYFGTDLEEQVAKKFSAKQEADREFAASGKSVESVIANIIQDIVENKDKIPMARCFDVPLSKYECYLKVEKDYHPGELRLSVSVGISGSDNTYSHYLEHFPTEEFFEYLQAKETQADILSSIFELIESWEKH